MSESASKSRVTLFHTDLLLRMTYENLASLSSNGAEKSCIDFGFLAYLP